LSRAVVFHGSPRKPNCKDEKVDLLFTRLMGPYPPHCPPTNFFLNSRFLWGLFDHFSPLHPRSIWVSFDQPSTPWLRSLVVRTNFQPPIPPWSLIYVKHTVASESQPWFPRRVGDQVVFAFGLWKVDSPLRPKDIAHTVFPFRPTGPPFVRLAHACL